MRSKLDARSTTFALAVLAVPNVVTGVWGVFAPRHWYEHFPGWMPRLVAALPPYNEHLTSDAASGVLAAGTAATIALLWRRRDVVLGAMATFLVFAWPHAIFHLRHPSDSLSGLANTMNTLTLWANALLAVWTAVVAYAAAQSGVAPAGGPGSRAVDQDGLESG